MARKVAQYVVPEEGRDKGKTFLITEMPASQAEAWATRVLLALMASDVEIPEGFANLGMAGLAPLAFRALSGLKWDVAEPLLAEMLSCVQIIPDPSKTHVVRPLIESDIEEVLTRIALRKEVWNLHTDFLGAVAPHLTDTERRPAARSQATRTSAK